MSGGEHSEYSELRRERESNSVPFSRSPFVSASDKNGADRANLEDGELHVKVAAEEPWTDLLLEVAMTTAFASLTDGTPILQRKALLSYLSFFTLVLWIWATQVAYNLRFRQSDWLHRIYVFLQLGVFSALAAFTHDFDITAGLLQDNDKALQDQLLLELGNDETTLQAIQFRDSRLPRLNARGVAMTMALSRLLLLVQYIVVFYRARHLKRSALLAYILPLALSMCCFFISFCLLGTGNEEVPKSIQGAKILLWYLPMLPEVASYFIANELPGRVAYPTEGIIARSGTVFIVILGGGLDKITTGFHYIIGNTGLGWDGIGLFFSAAVIFVSQFSLYFGSPCGNQKLTGHRSTAWFLSHFFYLSALIMTLQGVATSLSFSNINHAIQNQIESFTPTRNFIENNPGVNLTASDFPDSQLSFEKLGMSFPLVVQVLNTNIELGRQSNDSSMAGGAWLQQSLNLVQLVLEPFDAQPETRSLLWAKVQIFLNASPNNGTRVNEANWWDIYDGLTTSRGSSVLWFYPAAGTTLVALAMLSLIKGWPRDRFEWASITSRLFVGFSTLLLSMLDIDSSRPVFDSNGNLTSSMIWRLNSANWILPIFALAVGGLQLIEFVLAYFASRQYYSFDGLPFLKRQSAALISDQPFHPYHRVAIPEKAFLSSTPTHEYFPSQSLYSLTHTSLSSLNKG